MIVAWILEELGGFPVENSLLALLLTLVWAVVGFATALVVAYSEYNWLRRLPGLRRVFRSPSESSENLGVSIVRFVVFLVLLSLLVPLSAGPEIVP